MTPTTDPPAAIEGGCFCGAIRYAIECPGEPGGYLAANCHCTMCRRIHAAPYVAWLVVPAGKFRWLRGTPTALQSSTDGCRRFCAACGTHVTCVNATHPDIVDVSIGSLDRPQDFPATVQAFTDTRLAPATTA